MQRSKSPLSPKAHIPDRASYLQSAPAELQLCIAYGPSTVTKVFSTLDMHEMSGMFDDTVFSSKASKERMQTCIQESPWFRELVNAPHTLYLVLLRKERQKACLLQRVCFVGSRTSSPRSTLNSYLGPESDLSSESRFAICSRVRFSDRHVTCGFRKSFCTCTCLQPRRNAGNIRRCDVFKQDVPIQKCRLKKTSLLRCTPAYCGRGIRDGSVNLQSLFTRMRVRPCIRNFC